MIKRYFSVFIIIAFLCPVLYAAENQDQEYINKLTYQNSKLELVSRKRKIDEKRSYSYTDIDSYTYSIEAYSHTSTDISTQSLNRSEVKEISEWYIYKGGIRELSDAEFLELVGDQAELQRVIKIENDKANIRNIGNIFIGTGLAVMLGGAAFSADSAIISSGALALTGGFFLNAFNMSPQHYIQPDYAQQKIIDYNIALKRKLSLPLDYN
ncbi:MAG: hypothetical protein KKA31_05870 [Candidatus Margulisbacteria bacterium]|nr:hypothetical protein [Candidatus Margulisiibacteriota bacterium]